MKKWQEKQKRHQIDRRKRRLLDESEIRGLRNAGPNIPEKLEDMMCDFKRSTEAVGLEIHPDKTKILSNQATLKNREITVDNIKKEILRKK